MSFFSKLFGSKGQEAKPEVEEKEEISAPPVWKQGLPEEDDDEMFPDYDQLLEQAEAGDIDSMIAVGMAHIDGEGADIDLKKGLSFIVKAAEMGSVEAAGLLYEWSRDKINGLGKEKEEVLKYRDLAASLGDPVAQFQLGCCYAEESDQWSTYQQDKPLAHFWFARSAEQGSSLAAVGYAVGMLAGLAPLSELKLAEGERIVPPTEDQKSRAYVTDPAQLETLRANAWKIMESVSRYEDSAGLVTAKMLGGISRENQDYDALYRQMMETISKVRV